MGGRGRQVTSVPMVSTLPEHEKWLRRPSLCRFRPLRRTWGHVHNLDYTQLNSVQLHRYFVYACVFIHLTYLDRVANPDPVRQGPHLLTI